jgi:clan AA aspartic protease
LIQGKVVDLQIKVGVPFCLPGQPDIEIKFVVDTGFVGELTLPISAVAVLQLPFIQEIEANLADNQNVRIAAHAASILWDGEVLKVIVLAMGVRPLLGTALLKNYRLLAEFVDGHSVSLTKL